MVIVPLLFLVSLVDGPGHYDFSGPMAGFMVDGGIPGASTSGIEFKLIATNGGAMLAPTEFDLTNADWKSPLHVVLSDAKIDAGHLKAHFHFKNSTGSVLEGLRLDSSGVVESYTDTSGAAPGTKTRVEPGALPTPLLFGDLPPDAEATPVDVDLGPITFSPTATQVAIGFKLSGLTYVKAFRPEADYTGGRLSVDPKGLLCAQDSHGIWRMNPDGSMPLLAGKFGDQTDMAIVDPSNGDIVGSPSNSKRYQRYSAGGDDKGLCPTDAEFQTWPRQPRIASNGDLYLKVGDSIIVLRGDKIFKRVGGIPSVNVVDGDAYFDVAGDGTIYDPIPAGIFKIDPAGKTAKRITFGPDWHLGRVTNVQGVRLDSSGNLYVLEGTADGRTECPRVSVFDKAGHFVRVFGRAGKAPAARDFLPGSLGTGVTDIAFGADGTVYICCLPLGPQISMFKPF